jgi:membrane-associated phospholipid phosphatase
MSRASSLYLSTDSFSRYRNIFLAASIGVLTLFAGVLAARHSMAPLVGVHQGWQNGFDFAIESHLNRYVNRWPKFDSAMLVVVNRNLLKGGPIVFLCWAAFFERRRNASDLMENRAKLAATIPLAIVAVLVARVLAKVLPFRERPFRTAALHFQVPHGMSMERLYTWSSFPSDHAILFMTLAVGIFFASRRLGILALGYVVLFIMAPRVYLGWHWPTDVLSGAVLGLAFAAVATIPAYRNFVWRWVEKAWQSYPGAFAGAMFLLSYEITDLFDAPIQILSMLFKHKVS